ncbi:membrane-targeted effector domain-containing toxin [Pseudomonas sp. GD03842]|uniref:membrane-targeted effector domain-containing toxin n=1 Tax=Pseudomonas sp. GD03842 TaxID=2975385 RepID=UPI00244D2882|nr:membrane-targeted effector domain-containing toxin [Pseudomonas sp. GD03842]MDH0746565.1 membrane-targeted effector domain-containing toxin [Pseudomonas sp. GD03842]
MHRITPAPSSPEATHRQATEALQRLSQSDRTLSVELAQLPTITQTLVDALNSNDAPLIEQETADFLQRLDTWWNAPSHSGLRRRQLFTDHLESALRDEVILKCHEGRLTPGAAESLTTPAPQQNEATREQPQACSLHVRLDERTTVEIRGALVMSHPTGSTLLALPGIGLSEFPTLTALLKTLVEWLNDETLRRVLLINADQRHQASVFSVADDQDLFLSPFGQRDVVLHVITGAPYRFALQRQLEKQREDIIYACGDGRRTNPDRHAERITDAMRMHGLFGPASMLQQRERLLAESALRAKLPHWVKMAPAADLQTYVGHLKRYDQARDALSSALNGATSAQDFAQISLRTRLANDLGYDLDPATIFVSTQRLLPVTGEPYTVTRSLPELALHGLHPNDEQEGSAFLTHTTLRLNDAPIGSHHAALTPAYLARIIDELQLRIHFADYQRRAYAKPGHQKLMRDVLHLQIVESAMAGKMQGHISATDLALIETIGTTSDLNGTGLCVQQLNLDESATPGRILLFRKQATQNEQGRLVMFTADAPGDRRVYSFASETELLEELVGWSARPQMREYLLSQLPAELRPGIQASLDALALKPMPEPQFLRLTGLANYETALSTLVTQTIETNLSDLRTRTPDWYVNATAAQRQQLVALEDAAAGAIRNYAAKPHTQVQAFEDYVRQRASEKISQLLNVPAGTVDPDSVIIHSERETLSYTRMIRNGYDDSIGFLNPSADTMATFSGPEGVDLSPLTPARVAGSVRGKWLADDYAALVQRSLLDPQSAGYDYRRRTSTAITRLQMQSAALRSYLKGHIDAEQYQWLDAIICKVQRSDADTRTRFPVYPLQIHIDKPFIASRLHLLDQLVIPDTHLIHVETIQGCYVLLPTGTRHSALLYTPETPDGIEFRLFSSFVESLEQPGMIDYYKDRCRIGIRRVMSFFLNDMKKGNAHKAPFVPKNPILDFAQTCFNRPLERKLRDVADTTTGRSDMLSQLIWNSVEIIATVITLPFPLAAFAVGVTLSLRDSLHALQALTGETPEDASELILAAILNMAGAVGDLDQGLKGFGGVLRKLGKHSRPGMGPAFKPEAVRMSAPEKLFPVSLGDEPFLVAKPNANGHAQVYHNPSFEADEVFPTGHYATRNNTGTWQPLEDLPTQRNAPRAVDLSLEGLPRATEGHAAGVSLANGKCYIEMNGSSFQVHYDTSLMCWHIVDPENPFSFFGRQPVRLNEKGQWYTVERPGLRGGADRATPHSPQTSESVPVGLSAYELPRNLRPYLDEILTGSSLDPVGLGVEVYLAERFAQYRQTFAQLRENLYRDANTFFSNPLVIPPRPSLPAVDDASTFAGFLEDVFNHSNGLVLSEAPASVASKKLLMSHMQTLVDQRVEVLYIPHVFTDKHKAKLAKHHAKGSRVRSGSHEIKYHLKYLNGKALDNLSREYDYYHLIKQAHQHGIEVRPLSSSVSYPLEMHPVASAVGDTTAGQKMSNFFGHKLISSDVSAHPAKRWVALVDPRMATTHDQVPGLTQLQGCISAHIEQAPDGLATRVQRNAELVDASASSTACDFKIEVGDARYADTPAAGANTPLPAPDSDALVTAIRSPEDIGFRWDEFAGWRRVTSEQWLAEHPPTAVQHSLFDTAYNMPGENREAMFKLAYFKSKGLNSDYFFFDDELTVVQDKFFDLRAKLRNDARAILTADLPPRPAMPALVPTPDNAEFIRRLYQHTDGMVVGEYHASVGSKRFIIDHLPLLAEQQVKTLYLEHLLTDLHQADLDRYFETGQMTKRLLHSLKALDNGHMTDPRKVYNFEQLVIKAREHGLEVRAIDCAASYHLKGLPETTSSTRQEMMNYFASRTIRQHQAVMGKHRWVALVGNSHANRYKNVPGLAELEGAIGVRLDDVSAGTSRGVFIDPGEDLRRPMSNQTEFIKSDFMVEMENLNIPQVVRAPQPMSLEQRLARPGQFVTEQIGDTHFICHRSRDRAIYRTPVQVSAQGRVFVDRPSWAAVHLQPYNNIDALIMALEDINLTRVG